MTNAQAADVLRATLNKQTVLRSDWQAALARAIEVLEWWSDDEENCPIGKVDPEVSEAVVRESIRMMRAKFKGVT